MNISFIGWHVKDFIEVIGDNFPLLSQYADTQQDPEWHAEGDVEIHTNMVLDEAYKLIKHNNNLSKSQIGILILAALFHDYGKPISTKEVDISDVNRIAAPHHEEAGASLLLFADPPFDLSPKEWLSVIQLVAYHHIPKRLVIKDMPKSAYTKLTRQVDDIELLYLLEVADMTGRTCLDKEEQLVIMELFRLSAQEHGVWHKDPYSNVIGLVKKEFPTLTAQRHKAIEQQIISRYEDRQIIMFEEEIARAYGYKDNQSHLVILCGLPGSGKSTLVKSHFKDYEIVSLDVLREKHHGDRAHQGGNDEVVRLAHEEIKQHLRDNKNIVYDATNFRKDFRSKFAQLGFNYGAYVELIVLHTSLSKVMKGNKDRKHAVPKEVIESQIDYFQLPDIDEVHALSFVSR